MDFGKRRTEVHPRRTLGVLCHRLLRPRFRRFRGGLGGWVGSSGQRAGVVDDVGGWHRRQDGVVEAHIGIRGRGARPRRRRGGRQAAGRRWMTGRWGRPSW
jgi:hypothetical protein